MSWGDCDSGKGQILLLPARIGNGRIDGNRDVGDSIKVVRRQLLLSSNLSGMRSLNTKRW